MNYHAHIYFNLDQKQQASDLKEQFHRMDCPGVWIGKLHDRPIGLHTKLMFELNFGSSVFEIILNQLMFNHQELSVLIHPITNNTIKDHFEFSLWLGEKIELIKENI